MPFSTLDSWASSLAVAATRSSYIDVQELGIRCFENWENRNACEFLYKCSFSEKWLQEYANEVCRYILGEDAEGVLFEENFTWQMAN